MKSPFAIGSLALLFFSLNLAVDRPQWHNSIGSAAVSAQPAPPQANPAPTLTANDYYLSGNRKYDQKDYRGAILDYDRAIALNPRFADVYYQRGNTKFLGIKDYRGALLDFDRAIEIDPGFANAYLGRGLLKATALKDREGAIRDLRPAAKMFRAANKQKELKLTLEILAYLKATE
jgi:tetratricopeptide (TPR) repeat protein